MNKKLLPLLFIGLMGLTAVAQSNFSQLQYFVGSGSDTTMLVIDFKDASFDSSYAWGYIYSGTKTGDDMLYAISLADPNLYVNFDTASFGVFIQDIAFINHEGLGGSPDYWSTWDGISLDSLASNAGSGSALVPGGVFGLSYTDFNPAVKPGTPLPAYDPNALHFGKVDTWIGAGTDSLLFIIDFHDSSATSSFVWGYLFTDSVSYLNVLDDLAAADSQLVVTHSGAVLSIDYKAWFGMVNATSDWYVWEATNFGDWQLRYADPVYLHPGDFGAVVFSRFLRTDRPFMPVNVNNVGLASAALPRLNIYPNPVADILRIDGQFERVCIHDFSGKLVLEAAEARINLSMLPHGLYQVTIDRDGKQIYTETILKD